MAGSNPPQDSWRIVDVAEHLHVQPTTVRAYGSRGQMPPADGRDQYGPWWHQATILNWKRPGRGNRTPRPPEV